MIAQKECLPAVADQHDCVMRHFYFLHGHFSPCGGASVKLAPGIGRWRQFWAGCFCVKPV
jgi:hypothetical protein